MINKFQKKKKKNPLKGRIILNLKLGVKGHINRLGKCELSTLIDLLIFFKLALILSKLCWVYTSE